MMDFQSALIGQLDPTKKKAVQPGGMDLGAMGAGGIAPGEMNPNAGPALNVDPPPPMGVAGPLEPPTPTGPPQTTGAGDFGRTMGYDPRKFNDPNKHDFKYDTARVMSRFDPRQGFSPDVINALNSELGGTYGNFSGAGDKLSLTGAKGAKDAADFANQDWIYAHKANSDATKWNFGGGGAPDPAAAGGGEQGGMFAGSSLSPIMQGDAQGNIQEALGKLNAPSDLLQQLLAQLQGGQ